MFKGSRLYYYVLGLIFLTVIVLQYLQPKPINWTKTYFQKDKIPFGCFAIFNLLEHHYAQQVVTHKETLFRLNESFGDSTQSLILVNDQLEFSKLEVNALFNFIARGNTVLLSSEEFTGKLQDTFKLATSSDFINFSNDFDSLLTKKALDIRFIQPKKHRQNWYSYPQIASQRYFTKFDATLFKVSSTDNKNHPVLLQASIGKGKLLISSLPDVFANVFIVDHENRFYAYTLLSKLKNRTIIWDEYYKSHKIQNKGLLQFIFNHDALYMAYCILLVGLLFFMIFGMKRIQRPIPILKPLENSTLSFVEVISHVYFNSKNHKYIADEAIHYFYFDIRKRFGVDTSVLDEGFFRTIYQLSGIEEEELKKLFSYCERLKKTINLTQYDLLELNSRITNFKQKSIR